MMNFLDYHTAKIKIEMASNNRVYAKKNNAENDWTSNGIGS